ncbi:hypothetical protein IKS86_00290 [bacterium]|nr:hypothetical protein [bacterium]
MKKVLFLLTLLLVFVVSCGDSPASGQESSDTSAEETDSAESADDTAPADSGEPAEPTDQTGDTEPAEPSETPDADKESEEPSPEEPATEKFCQYVCTTASDCVPAGANAITDADNYKCEDGKCVYLGCLSDDECDEIYGSVTAANGKVYRCNKNGAYGYPECTLTCSTAADCDLYGQGTSQYAYDLDNYKCEGGLCVFTGCNSDAECEATMSSSDYKCMPQEYTGKTLKICNLPCKSAADCANSVYPEEFYECRNSLCVAKSCESDEWCKKYMTDDYVCK